MSTNGSDPLAPLVDALAEQLGPLVAELVAKRLEAPAREAPWRLLTVEQAARRLGRSPKWIRAHKDEVGWVKLDGGGFAFDVEDLRRFARARRVPEPHD